MYWIGSSRIPPILVNIKLRFTVIPSLATEILKEIAENNYNVLWGKALK